MNRIGIVAVIYAVLSYSSSSFAEFIVLSENGTGAGWENVQLVDDSVGLTVQGASNQTNTDVNFTTASQFLTSSGQRIEARELNDIDSDQAAIDGPVTITLANAGLSFGGLSFNAFGGGPLGGEGTLTIEVSGFESNGDPVSATLTQDEDGDPLTLGNGANFFSVLAINGQRLRSVEIRPDSDSSYAYLQNVRVLNVVPEPTTYAYYILLMSIGSLIAWRLR